MVWREAEALTETLEIVQEVQQDLAQLKPNVILETMKSWIPGLIKLGYRLFFFRRCTRVSAGWRSLLRRKSLGSVPPPS